MLSLQISLFVIAKTRFRLPIITIPNIEVIIHTCIDLPIVIIVIVFWYFIISITRVRIRVIIRGVLCLHIGRRLQQWKLFF